MRGCKAISCMAHLDPPSAGSMAATTPPNAAANSAIRACSATNQQLHCRVLKRKACLPHNKTISFSNAPAGNCV